MLGSQHLPKQSPRIIGIIKIWEIAWILCLFLILFLPCSITATDSSFPPAIAKEFIARVKKTLPAILHIQTNTCDGSGFFIREDGYIITSSHLLENANTIKVRTYNNQIFEAQIIELDLNTDIAIIKIEGSNFSFLNYGNSDELKVGDFVISIGYSSCTLGIVKETEIRNIGLFQTEDFIKTSAMISLGSSGGPLLNAKGEVVGLNAATLVDREGKYLEESLAISSKLALQAFCKLSQFKTY